MLIFWTWISIGFCSTCLSYYTGYACPADVGEPDIFDHAIFFLLGTALGPLTAGMLLYAWSTRNNAPH